MEAVLSFIAVGEVLRSRKDCLKLASKRGNAICVSAGFTQKLENVDNFE